MTCYMQCSCLDHTKTTGLSQANSLLLSTFHIVYHQLFYLNVITEFVFFKRIRITLYLCTCYVCTATKIVTMNLADLGTSSKVYLALLAHFALNRMPQVIFSWDEKIKLTHSSCLQIMVNQVRYHYHFHVLGIRGIMYIIISHMHR